MESLGARSYQDTLTFLLQNDDDIGMEAAREEIRKLTRIKAIRWLEVHGFRGVRNKTTFDTDFPTQGLVHKLLLRIYEDKRHTEGFHSSFLRELRLLNNTNGRGVRTACVTIEKESLYPGMLRDYE